MKNLLLFAFSFVMLTGCNFKKSVNIDLTTGLSSKGNGLSCDDVTISSYGEKIADNTFIIGQEITFGFENIEGFKKVNGGFFAGMTITVYDQSGKKVMATNDLYADVNSPVKISPASLSADLTLGLPMRSGEKYKAIVRIWDKKGTGTFESELEYSLQASPVMRTDFNKTSCDEVLLFDTKTEKIVGIDPVPFDSKFLILYAGVRGFAKNEAGNYEPGISITAKDETGNVLLDLTDIAEGQFDEEKMKQLPFTFNLGKDSKGHSVHVEIMIYDRLSSASVNTSIDLKVG